MAQEPRAYHTPVLGPETADWVVTRPRGTYVDATVGGGGHAELLLDRMNVEGRLIGVDRDPQAIRAASDRLSPFETRVECVQGVFWDLRDIITRAGVDRMAGIVFDLGPSSHQIDVSERGFSYQKDGPLDMRMGPDAQRSAAEVVNSYSQAALTQIFKTFGEERAAARIARSICRHRQQSALERTSELAELVAEQTRGRRVQKSLARVFQAVRIEVNQEVDRLDASLTDAIALLEPEGRIGVLSYHSVEDRIVKASFRKAVRGCVCPPDLPICACGHKKKLKILTARGIRAGADERAENPRSRSATLRVGERLADS